MTTTWIKLQEQKDTFIDVVVPARGRTLYKPSCVAKATSEFLARVRQRTLALLGNEGVDDDSLTTKLYSKRNTNHTFQDGSFYQGEWESV